MENFSKDEVSRGLETTDWKSQLPYIEKIETAILDSENSADPLKPPASYFKLIDHFLSGTNKNVLQRSLRLLEALCAPNFADFEIPSSLMRELVLLCQDNRSNIRQQALRSVSSLVKKCGPTELFNAVSEEAQSILPELRSDILTLVLLNLEGRSKEEIQPVCHFVLLCLDDKVNCPKLSASDLGKNAEFIAAVSTVMEFLPPPLKKVAQNLVDQYGTTDDTAPMESVVEGKDTPVSLFINTSAFSRRLRISSMSDDDSIRLLSDLSVYSSVYSRLAQDISDVFDEEVAAQLLSLQSSERLDGVVSLRKIFESDQKHFENCTDIVIRWACFQFLGRNISVAQASLSLLLDNLAKHPKLVRTELCFCVPILLWCVATKSDAYSNLLHELRFCSSSADLGAALLLSFSLGHIVVITTAYEVLNTLDDISSIEPRLKELTSNRCTMISEGAKQLLYNISSSTSQSVSQDPVVELQKYIQRIQSSPDLITDAKEIFNVIYTLCKSQPKEDREIRYLLYCMHSFLSEPVLSHSIPMDQKLKLLQSLLEFSVNCNESYGEALQAVGYALASACCCEGFFEVIIDFISSSKATFTRQTFCAQLFMTGVSLLSIRGHSEDISNLRAFCKRVFAIPGLAKDDIRASLCHSLLGEIVVVEQQQLAEMELFRNLKPNERIRSMTGESAADSLHKEGIKVTKDLTTFAGILNKLCSSTNIHGALAELAAFDSNHQGLSITQAVLELVPGLRSEYESLVSKK